MVVGHPRGLVLTVVAIVILILGEISLSYMTGIGIVVTTARELAISNGINILLFGLLLVLLKELGKVNLGSLFFSQLPHLRDALLWVSVAVVLHVPGFVVDNRLPTYFGYEGYVTFELLHAFRATIVAPLVEETLFRGVCFGSLQPTGRVRAYVLSNLLFLLWHVKLVDLVIHGTTGLTWLHMGSIVVVGFLAAYIYEKTGKLTLCIIFHGAGNAFVTSRPFFMYFLDP